MTSKTFDWPCKPWVSVFDNEWVPCCALLRWRFPAGTTCYLRSEHRAHRIRFLHVYLYGIIPRISTLANTIIGLTRYTYRYIAYGENRVNILYFNWIGFQQFIIAQFLLALFQSASNIIIWVTLSRTIPFSIDLSPEDHRFSSLPVLGIFSVPYSCHGEH